LVMKVQQQTARLAQSVERQTLNLVVVGSSPTVGVVFLLLFLLTVVLYRYHRIYDALRFPIVPQ
jgi:hypothetical protein